MLKCFADNSFEKEIVMFLDYCKDGLLEKMQEVLEKEGRPQAEKIRLMTAKDKHE
jgi:hypothetical protein